MKRAAPVAVRSNRIRSHAFRFLMECSWKFGSKNVCISNQPNVCIFDDPCLSKFGALRGCVRNPQTMSGFPCVPCGTRQQVA